jgi:hypothetical protein
LPGFPTGHGYARPRAMMHRKVTDFRRLGNRGRRESRMPNAPAALRVKIENTQVSHHRFTGSIRPSLRDGFNGLLRALPGDRAFLSPSPAACPCWLDISVEISGPRGFAVRVRCIRLLHRPRPSHPAPNVRDDREAPLLRGTGRPKEMAVICPTEQAKYFWLNIWTESPDARQKFTDLPVGQIW